MQEQVARSEQLIGHVTHYWGKPHAAGVHLTGPVDVGDTIHFVGPTSDFRQQVASMEIEHHKIQHGAPGADVAVEVSEHPHQNDLVFRMLAPGDIGRGQGTL